VKREQRLRTPAEFQRVRSLARAWRHPLVVLDVAPNEVARTRVGITVSRAVGNAVVRNRVRRRLRAIFQARYAHLAPGHDLRVVARPATATASFAELRDAVDRLLTRAELIA
jgi:ribonuclease P protein component